MAPFSSRHVGAGVASALRGIDVIQGPAVSDTAFALAGAALVRAALALDRLIGRRDATAEKPAA